MPERSLTFQTLDGLDLAGDLAEPDSPGDTAVVLVHGGGVTRHEAGFFDRLATGLADAGMASLRFDMRGHGESAGRQEDLTLASVLNDIRVAIETVRRETRASRIGLAAQSFSGGIAAYYAAKRPDEVDRLVLLCPRIDYKLRTIDSKPYWSNDRLDPDKAAELADQGYIQYSQNFRHGPAILNEVFWLQPHRCLDEIQAPTLIIHGTADTLVPIDTSIEAMDHLNDASRLMRIEGAQHGFAVDNDPTYLDPQSQQWQAEVIRAAAEWINPAR